VPMKWKDMKVQWNAMIDISESYTCGQWSQWNEMMWERLWNGHFYILVCSFIFFFNIKSTFDIFTFSLHDALLMGFQELAPSLRP